MKNKQTKLTRKVIYEAGARCGSAGDIILIKILNRMNKMFKHYEKKAIKAQSDKSTS